MKKSRFNEEQMVRIVRESDAAGVPATAKKNAISEQTLYLWRKKFGTLEASDVKRLKHLEIENGRLKKIVAERDLELEVMKEINAKKWQAHRRADRGWSSQVIAEFRCGGRVR